MKNRIVPIVAVLVGLLAFLVSHQYIRSEYKKVQALKAEIYKGARMINVLGTDKDIPAGTVISKEDIGKLPIFEVSAPDHIILPEEYEMVVGKKTRFPISARKPILWTDIEGGVPAGSGLSSIVDHSMRAVSLSVGGSAAVSGMVQPNDHVDIIGSFAFPAKDKPGEMEMCTLTVLQDVTVLATGQTMANQAAGKRGAAPAGGYGSITLAVTPREAELLVFAQHSKGQLAVTLRNPADVSFEKDLPSVDFGHIEKKIPDYNLFRQKNVRHKTNL